MNSSLAVFYSNTRFICVAKLLTILPYFNIWGDSDQVVIAILQPLKVRDCVENITNS